jgi:hypothetical protein
MRFTLSDMQVSSENWNLEYLVWFSLNFGMIVKLLTFFHRG